MKAAWVVGVLLAWPSLAWADLVCLEKGTGKLIQYLSDGTPGTCFLNYGDAQPARGYTDAQIEEQQVTKAEWALIKEQWIDGPAREALEQKESERQAKEDEIQAVLSLTDDQMTALKTALGR